MTWHQGRRALRDELCREPPAFASSSAGGPCAALEKLLGLRKREMCPFLWELPGEYGIKMEKVGADILGAEHAFGPIHLRRTALAGSTRQSGPWQAGWEDCLRLP